MSVRTVASKFVELCRQGKNFDVMRTMYSPTIISVEGDGKQTAGQGPVNRVLLDRDFEAGDEPVKLCVRAGVPVELRKQLAPDLKYDTIGESVGFFRFDAAGARRLAAIVSDYVGSDRAHLPHEEAVRDLYREASQVVEVADVTGSPWIEIDFPNDVARAAQEVLPQLQRPA